MDQKLLKKVKRRDRIARWVITVGGMAIIFVVIFILLLIGEVSLPLFNQPTAAPVARIHPVDSQGGEAVLALGLDEYLETAFTLSASGDFTFYDLPSGEVSEQISLHPPGAPEASIVAAEKFGRQAYGLLWSDGVLSIEQLRFSAQWDEHHNRTFEIAVDREGVFAAPEGGVPEISRGRISNEGTHTRVSLMGDNRLLLTQEAVTADIFGNEERMQFSTVLGDEEPDRLTALALDTQGHALYAGTDQGALLRWDLSEAGSPRLVERQQAFRDRRAITALTLVFGDISLAVGDTKGQLTTWFPVRTGAEGGEKRLRRIHTLADRGSAVRTISPSHRDKSLLSLDEEGTVYLDHMTSERQLLTLEGSSPLRTAALNLRGTGIIALNEKGQLEAWTVDNPHPEVSWRTLFGKVWYESYDEPAYVWQSSSASEDFEPKLSLTPLIFGTLKGTFYAMIFAVPLALLGAIYTSQFGHPKLRQYIKPTVEIMAAIPSVIIGFLAALWLAPIVEKSVTAIFLSFLFVPTSFILFSLLWQKLREVGPLRKVERGFEFLTFAPVIVLSVAAAFAIGPLVEAWLFGGDFRLWLFTEMGTRYDPRNNIIIAFALGFAVIPIIFTIAEDALSNVPGSLKAASLAMGASRWQTVWRVILPSASPGIFAGIMIGFGRAIGETMIVLMATGNTAIMDLSIFNGMRPLSANIAVEIPEAPVASTLYRVLFLSAVILFLFTFVLNTIAEVVRQRLRKKYGRF
ncbi:ABC transporter permease subunit [Desulfuromonas sp. AOP6]|uniref:ABC transporter permease subunit n=1 Tax=Desulfuromonas sp. AOP6 TaxID=1566351 RepID=UPI0012DC5856|nr:ABC transporter permease subunit [Desulfuromonas sp. AOP6]